MRWCGAFSAHIDLVRTVPEVDWLWSGAPPLHRALSLASTQLKLKAEGYFQKASQQATLCASFDRSVIFMKRPAAEAHSVRLDQNGLPRATTELIYYRIRQATAQQVALVLSRVPPIVVKRG